MSTTLDRSIESAADVLKANNVERQNAAYIVDCAVAEIALLRHDLGELRAENEKLRKALEEIAEANMEPAEVSNWQRGDIARLALGKAAR